MIKTLSDGTKIYYQGNLIHREDGPAYIAPNGVEGWFFEGMKHRIGGPAITKINGITEYWEHGVKIREELDNKTRNINGMWYRNGVPHNDNGPTFKHDLVEVWYKDGLLHRSEDQPAVIFAYTDDILKEFKYSRDYLGKIHHIGEKYWFINGKLSRENGPAYESESDENFVWYKDGLIHRIGGPAVYSKCHKCGENYVSCWLVDGLFHRDDGPAVEHSTGHKEWWLNGVKQKEELEEGEEKDKCILPSCLDEEEKDEYGRYCSDWAADFIEQHLFYEKDDKENILMNGVPRMFEKHL